MTASICVIIPAFNAERTIGRAVRSALAQPETAEVIVIDDASTDGTIAAAERAGEGSARLSIIRFATNRGPSAARNAAFDASTSPLIAILDADDYLVAGRFGHLAAGDDWDMIAENILFVPEAIADSFDATALPNAGNRRRTLGLSEFVERNISKPGHPRGELGFLKPLIRRSLLDRLALRYDETMRLGEDYILYATALARGARFVLAEVCGYVAVERRDSLSGRHRTADLAALLAADQRLARDATIAPGERALLARHVASIREKYDHRRFLDDKASCGIAAALAPLLGRPAALARVARAIIRDKIASTNVGPDIGPYISQAGAPRLLFDRAEFGN